MCCERWFLLHITTHPVYSKSPQANCDHISSLWRCGADLHSTRLFCSGVPVSTTLRRVLMAFIALEMLDASLRRMCPSSQTTKSGPENNNTGEKTVTNRNCVNEQSNDTQSRKHFNNILLYQSYCTWIHQYALQRCLPLLADFLGLWLDAVHLISHYHDPSVSLPPLQSSESFKRLLYCSQFCDL